MSEQPTRPVRTAVLIPCFNEAATIGKVVRDFLEADPGVTVYVYDNNSTDGTPQIAEKAGAVVGFEYAQGKGRVVRRMFRDVDADVYIMVDGDDTYPAKEALEMRRLVVNGYADMVVGDRLTSTYFRENTRQFHGFGNRLVRFLVNWLFNSELHDIMSGCRCMSREFVKNMPILSSGFEIETEMSIHALDKGFLVREVPVAYRDRGQGSVSKLNTISDGKRVLSTLMRLFQDYRPFRFFAAVASLLLAVSLFLVWQPLADYFATGLVNRVPTLVVSAGLGISSLVSFVCGVLLDSILDQSRRAYELQLALFRELDSKISKL